MKTEDFPTLFSALPEKSRRRRDFADALRDFTIGMEIGEIPNTRWNEAKSDLNRVLEEGYKALISEPFFYSRRYEDQPIEIRELHDRSTPQLHTLKGWDKHVAKLKLEHPVATAIRDFLAEVRPLGEAAEFLKGHVKKREVKPPEEQKARFVPKHASEASIEKVREALETITTNAYTALKDGFQRRYTSMVAKYLESQQGKEKQQHPYEFYMSRKSPHGVDPEAYSVVNHCVDFKEFPAKETGAFRRPDADKVIADMAEKNAEEIRDAFINKNLRKLASVVDGKKNLASVDVIDYTVDLASLRGTLRLSFEDGARFRVQNEVVWSRSIHNKTFLRFPLTFHDVVFPDGKSMKQPSEEKMNTEFAGRYYGTIKAPESERDMIASLGVRLSTYDPVKGTFLAEANYAARAKLSEFKQDFEADLHLRACKPLAEMTAEQLATEVRFHDWALGSGDKASASEAERIIAVVRAQIAHLEKKGAFEKARAGNDLKGGGPEPV